MKQIKSCLLLAGLLWMSVRAFAAPAVPANPPVAKDTKSSVTQISLLTADGLVPTDRIIFNQDGTATRTTGVGNDDPRIDNPEKTIQLRGQIPALQFKRLVALIESVEYFKLERIYTSYDWTPSYFVEVAKGEEKKGITVRDGNNFGGGHTPIGLWGLNMAIRGIAADIKWEQDGEYKEGVFIPRRDTNSWFNKQLGGRVFPGIFQRSHFEASETDTSVSLRVVRADGGTEISFSGHVTDDLHSTSLFPSLKDAAGFFSLGATGYSATHVKGHYHGMDLKSKNWSVASLEIDEARSCFFDDTNRFPSGTAELDCALLMRDIEHEWHSQPDIYVSAQTGLLTTQRSRQ